MNCSMPSIILGLMFFGYAGAQDINVANPQKLRTHLANDVPTYHLKAPQKDLAGRYGLLIQFGFLSADKLCIEYDSKPQQRGGITFAGGLYYFVGKNVSLEIDAAYTPFPEWFRLWGEHRSWSMLELGVHLKCINSPFSAASFYEKFGLKMSRLSGSLSPGTGLFGGTVGSNIKIKTSFAPGWELAFGLNTRPTSETSFFIEVAFGYVWMKDKNVRANNEAAVEAYPYNLILIGVKIGVLLQIGGE